jgi:hypothetical protein
MNYPSMYRVQQVFETPSIRDVAAHIRKEFSAFGIADHVSPGQTVAITAGSRGIHEYVSILATLVECLRGAGLKPFILPAMGSHGGATAEGQERMLNGLGVCESAVSAPIVSSMDVESLGRTPSGAEVYFSKDAIKADHLVVVNRVKAHTAFHSDVESGLCKMLAVGCGKHTGALNMHKYGLAETIVPAAEIILRKIPVLFGVAIVENALEQAQTLRFTPPVRFVETDRELLVAARANMPRIPVDHLDVLIVDEMGKDISGVGMDPNVIGFWRRDGGERKPDFQTLILLDLTAHSEGNALGMGFVDLTTRRVMDKVDFQATYANALTTGILRSVRFPVTLENDRAVLDAALLHIPDLSRIRMIRIVNTLKLDTFWASGTLLPELRSQPHIVVDDRPLPIAFNEESRMLPLEAREARAEIKCPA